MSTADSVDTRKAFALARDYLTGDPIYAEWTSVTPLLVLQSEPAGPWMVVCEYERTGQSSILDGPAGEQSKEKAIVFVDGQGRVTGFGKL